MENKLKYQEIFNSLMLDDKFGAEEKAWHNYGSDSSCRLEVWEVSGNSESFCAYYPKVER